MKDVNELIKHIELEQLDSLLFRGFNENIGSPNVFGGQVLAQALNAAIRTVPEDRFTHSLHAYFVLPGNLDLPIIYEVDKIRDGGSFTTRNIKAIQKGRAIFHMSASFQLLQEGYDHQVEMPEGIKPPDQLFSWDDIATKFKDFLPEYHKKFLDRPRPIDFKPVEMDNPLEKKKKKPYRHVWLKAKGEVPQDRVIQQQILAYASDYNLLATALLPHGDVATFSNVQMANLDHAMWFHRDFDINDWLLYALDSPSASNTRGFTRGNIFSRDGKLVASVVQEGLMRPKS